MWHQVDMKLIYKCRNKLYYLRNVF